ncbi:sulfatase family protein [Pontiella agarivorans]|uniref:Sulfatase n=1 Tax=Pontiella agarivorans TaxID=3038953 RepID=A0ABU5MSB6_9BACT|nr:sulfatase [Pontiella agarivorans]MDZ8117026.1 sulfatase [Pontiella agarivorans]
MKKYWNSGWVFAGLLVLGCGIVQAAPRKPNVIIILTDDQGYGDLSCYGSTKIKSPNLDRLAEEGLRLTGFYSASSICSPSRAALLTGRMPKRVGVPDVFFPYSNDGLPEEEITLAEMLRAQGYRTALIGKWHLGHQKRFLPLNQGFDSYFGIPYSNDMSVSADLEISPHVKLNQGYTMAKLEQDCATVEKNYKKLKNRVPLMRDNQVVEYPANQETLTKVYTQAAVEFIRSASEQQPFFLCLAHSMPHRPWHIEKQYQGQSGGGLYGDVIEQLDWSVGEVVAALKDQGLDQNTIVFFTSDNGPIASGGSAGPFSGTKASTYEGGHRVAAIFWGPGLIPPNRVSDVLMTSMDIFPTLAHYAGASLPGDRIYDGVNFSALLEGREASAARSEFVYYVAKTELVDGIRVGDWKYLLRGKRRPKPKDIKPQLFNLKNDPAEQNNLIGQNPEKAQELAQKMKQFDAQFKP